MQNKKIMATICLLAVMLSAVLLAVKPVALADSKLIFEESFEGDEIGWQMYSYNDGASEFVLDTERYRTGMQSLLINSNNDNDARVYKTLTVEPQSYYIVTAYAMVRDVEEDTFAASRIGATISVMDTLFTSNSVDGTTGWEKLTFAFCTGSNQTSVEICFTLGGYGRVNRGQAWFDDIAVEQLDAKPADCVQLGEEDQLTYGNLILNGGFEEGDAYWARYSYHESATTFHLDDTVSRSGKYSMMISNESANDARIVQEVAVKPNKYYTATAYVRTVDVPYSTDENPCYGATISVMGTTFTSISVSGNNTWRMIAFSFYTDVDQTSVELCFTLGGYSMVNTGKAWFDDISVRQESSRPDQVYILSYDDSTDMPSTDHWAGYTITEFADEIKWIAFAFIWFAVLAIFALIYAENGQIPGTERKLKYAFAFIMAGGLVLRIVTGLYVKGFTYDIGLFKSWSWYASTSLFTMYNGDFFLDYPPLYMYVLAPLGGIVNLLDNVGMGDLSNLLIKLPSIIADMVCAWLLYRLASKYLDKKWAVYISAFYVLNPMVWINSSCWGQVDSLFTMLILIELTFLIEKKWVGAGIMFAFMVLMKPHGIIFTPAIGLALLIEVIKTKSFKPMLVALGSGVAAGVVVVLPFYIGMGFENPTWILDLYMGTIEQYDYATINGFNFYAMLGKNLLSAQSEMLGLTFAQWGKMGIGFAILLSIVFMAASTRKGMKSSFAAPVIVSMVLIVTVFTFAHKMHERYMFAAVALALLSFILTRERGYMYLAIYFSVLVFINTYYIYDLNMTWIYCHPRQEDKLVMLFGGMEFLGFLLMLGVVIKTTVKNIISAPKSLKEIPTEVEKEVTND